jgi:pimeloyl-ACP methyl ester carboxylesterase
VEDVRGIWDKELRKSAADDRYVLDRLTAMNSAPGSEWAGRMNLSEVGAIGHSFGGAVSTEACAEDRRIRSAVNIDGWFFGAIRARGAGQPLMFMHESWGNEAAMAAEANPPVGDALDITDSAELDASLRKFGGYEVIVPRVHHEDFTDQPLMSPLPSVVRRGTLPAKRVQDIVRAYVLAFLDKTVRGEDPAILHQEPGPFAEAKLVVRPEPEASSATVGKAR